MLTEVGCFSLLATTLGVVMTTLYLAGLVERRNFTVFRMGLDSAGALLIYVGGSFSCITCDSTV
jgi:cation:H+ antiporter